MDSTPIIEYIIYILAPVSASEAKCLNIFCKPLLKDEAKRKFDLNTISWISKEEQSEWAVFFTKTDIKTDNFPFFV